MEDSPWKAAKVSELVHDAGLKPDSICEVGCGAGAILAALRGHFPKARLYGFDIAPDAARFWDQHAHADIIFETGDFLEINQRKYDLILTLDVIEHVQDPAEFLSRLRQHSEKFIFHIPLDLSALSVLREQPLLYVRRKVGHIHYFTKGLALALLDECGYEVLDWRYTGAAFSTPVKSWKTRFAALPRRLAYWFNRDVGVRLLGGETLIVLASPKD
jgi:cyclopropane fatty-acyl-phospholipid synthase-like methyltransferase